MHEVVMNRPFGTANLIRGSVLTLEITWLTPIDAREKHNAHVNCMSLTVIWTHLGSFLFEILASTFA